MGNDNLHQDEKSAIPVDILLGYAYTDLIYSRPLSQFKSKSSGKGKLIRERR